MIRVCAEAILANGAPVRTQLQTSTSRHLICVGCGELIEFYSEIIENMQDKMAKYKFRPTHHSLRIFGYCAKCEAAKNQTEPGGRLIRPSMQFFGMGLFSSMPDSISTLIFQAASRQSNEFDSSYLWLNKCC